MTSRSEQISERRHGGAGRGVRAHRACFPVLAATLAACTRVGGAPSVPPHPGYQTTTLSRSAPDSATRCPDTPGQRVLDLVNRRRGEARLPRLRVDPRLVEAARKHAQDMAQGGPFGHVGSDGTSPADRVRQAGYVFLTAGENVAAGMSSPDEAVKDWMGSPEHRVNILGGYTQTGIAYVHARFSPYGSYWVEVFGTLLHPSENEKGLACNP